MADREVDQFFRDQTLDTMPDEDVGHVCTYTKDSDDPNFKYCIYCSRVKYRTDEELIDEYATKLERKLRGV